MKKPPFVWELEDLSVGEHTLVVEAEIKDSKSSVKSEAVEIRVVADKSEDPSKKGSNKDDPSNKEDDVGSGSADSGDGDEDSLDSGDKDSAESSPEADQEHEPRKGGCRAYAPSEGARGELWGLACIMLGLRLWRRRQGA